MLKQISPSAGHTSGGATDTHRRAVAPLGEVVQWNWDIRTSARQLMERNPGMKLADAITAAIDARLKVRRKENEHV